MNSFTYEEQGEKKYLVYTKTKEDDLDMFTMEMLMNNKIAGTASFSCIQMDDTIYMKYNITGLQSMSEFLSGEVKKHDFLKLLKSLTDSLIIADEYMLNVSSYILDTSYIYIYPTDMQVSMIVLPVRRDEIPPENFLKKLLFDVKYDRTEDRSYVASLISFFGSSGVFSLTSFRDQVCQFDKNNYPGYQNRGYVENPVNNRQPVYENRISNKAGERESYIPENKSNEAPVRKHAAPTPEKQECLDILFSDAPEEEEKKTKKGFFAKTKKGEKKEKGFRIGFGKKSKAGREGETDPGINMGSPIDGLAIPGMDFPRGRQTGESTNGKTEKKEMNQIENPAQFMSIPAQNVNIRQMEAQQQDFGETLYLQDDSDETVLIDQNQYRAKPKYILYRCSTQESFELKGDIIRIGRNPRISEICISGNRGIGRIHAILYMRDGQVFISDNDSKNKTYVDGEQIKADAEPKLLLSGSKIRLGDEEFEFRISV